MTGWQAAVVRAVADADREARYLLACNRAEPPRPKPTERELRAYTRRRHERGQR